ncbi:MAG: hypothetical protein ACRD4R_09925 [Candidatus Acidiferrales bacterium]
MANPISGAYQAHETPEIHQTAQTNATNKPVDQTEAPQDTVTISQAGQAAHQASQQARHTQQEPQTQQTGADAAHNEK